MSSPARKLDIREANEALILRAAEKQFALHGFRGTTTEGIANEAGLPKANVHYYFKTKANLYRQVLKGILEDWMDAAAAFEADEDPERALTMYITAKKTGSPSHLCVTMSSTRSVNVMRSMCGRWSDWRTMPLI